jgi:hypothetical protein
VAEPRRRLNKALPGFGFHPGKSDNICHPLQTVGSRTTHQRRSFELRTPARKIQLYLPPPGTVGSRTKPRHRPWFIRLFGFRPRKSDFICHPSAGWWIASQKPLRPVLAIRLRAVGQENPTIFATRGFGALPNAGAGIVTNCYSQGPSMEAVCGDPPLKAAP